MVNVINQSTRTRTLLITALIIVGITFGSVFAYLEHANGTKDILILDFINGKIILDPEDRELLKQQIIDTTLANDAVN